MKIKVLVISKNGAVEIYEASAEGLKVLAQSGVQYRLIDVESGLAPGKVYLKRNGDDLELRFDAEEADEPDVVIENHFQHIASPVVGQGADGVLYSYAPEGGNQLNSLSEAGKDYVLPEAGVLAHEAVWLDSMAFLPSAEPIVAGGDLGWMGPAALLGGFVAAASSGSGDGTNAASGTDSYNISGTYSAGPVVEGNGLTAIAYDKEGNELDRGKIDGNGQFNIEVSNGYSGSVLIIAVDETEGVDYWDETTNQEVDASGELRVITTADGSSDISVNITPLTELATLIALDDGDGGEAQTLAEAGAEKAEIDKANEEVAEQFGLEDADGNPLDITTAQVELVVDEQGNPEAANGYGYILAAISGMEKNSGKSTDEVLDEIHNGTGADGALDQNIVDKMAAGAKTADDVDGSLGGAEAFIRGIFGSAISNIALSDDRGASESDFITDTAEQTITATLDEALSSGIKLWGSVDGGETWVDITSSVTDTTVSWAGVILSGTNSIKFATTDDSIIESSDVAANVIGNIASQLYIFDKTAPDITSDSFDADENGVAVGTVAVTDANGIPETGAYRISGGADAALFSINDAGELTFLEFEGQDYESPEDGGEDGVYDLKVTVTDNAGNESTQAITVNLQDVNEAPTVVSAEDRSAGDEVTAIKDQGVSIDASAYFEDVDAGDTLTYTAAGLPDGMSINASTGAITGTPTAEVTDKVVTITATDSGSKSVDHKISLDVVGAPAISAIALKDGEGTHKSGESVTFLVTLSEAVTIAGGTPTLTLDVNGVQVTATYSAGSGTADLEFTATVPAGDGNNVSVSAIDLAGATVIGDTTTQSLVTTSVGQDTTDLTVDNTDPDITTNAFDADENGTAVGKVAVTDAGGMPATGAYTLGGIDAALFNIADDATLTFKDAKNFESPDDAGADGVYDLDVTVTDNAGNTVTEAITVNLQDVNEAPTVSTEIGDQSAVKDQAFSLDISSNFTDLDADTTLTYSLSNAPDWMSIDSVTGEISGTPTAGADAVTVTVTASDGSLSVSDVFDIPVSVAPVISSISAEQTLVKEGDEIIFTLTLSEAVTITVPNPDGIPTITVDINGQSVTATYAGGTGTNTLTFEAVAAPVGNGNSVSLTSINLNGATITGDTTQQPLVTTAGQKVTTLTVDNTNPDITTNAFDVDENSTAVGKVAVTDAGGLPVTGSPTLVGGSEGGWGNAGAFTSDGISGDGSVSVQAGQTDKSVAFGLSADDPDSHYNTIDYAFSLSSAGEVKIFENGSFIGEFGTYTPDDVFSVERNGDTITYLKNGEVLHTSAITTSAELFLDTAIVGVGTTLTNVRMTDGTGNNDFVPHFSNMNNVTASSAYIGGADAALFNLADDGTLTFKDAKNFESLDDAGADGVYDLDVTVTDNAGNESTQAVTVTLQDVNEAPTVVSAEDRSAGDEVTAIKDQSASIDASAYFEDVDDGDTLTYTAAGLPDGMSINASTGAITGTPTAEVTDKVVTITATDSGSKSVDHKISLDVVGAPVATSLVDEVTNIDVRSPIVLTFTEAVTANAGFDITFTDTTVSGWKNDTTDNSFALDATDPRVSISADGKTVTIDPEFDFDFGTDYTINIEAGAFTGSSSDQASVEADMSFTTVTPEVGGAASKKQVAGTDELVDSYNWVDGHQGSPMTAATEVDATDSSIAVVLSFDSSNVTDNGHISYKGVGVDDLLYLDKSDNTVPDGDIDGGGAWSSAVDSDGVTSPRKSFSGNDLGADVIYNNQTDIWADYFLTDSIGVNTIVIG